MTQAQVQTHETSPKLYTYDEFIEWYPDSTLRYELHNGVIVEMPHQLATMKML